MKESKILRGSKEKKTKDCLHEMPKPACYSFPLQTSFSNRMTQTDITQGTASSCDFSPKRKCQRKTVSSPRTRSIKKVNRKEKEVTTQ